ncbi:transmembrane protein [Cavenderia fasciculata]|uniref:Transmembrane protein n=1 Tax=Cavenderia fasciculata TaxID=261658 RepID=F4PM15_CACFS|nr:uncharacterized protein DFA_04848 [Cavenderia fasciculata]EGG22718.1 transmembrane protein [Cavenderia fasciculata]|eukprot:XP_004360569.1 transmembrane protein [Cavenderia fasciculata]
MTKGKVLSDSDIKQRIELLEKRKENRKNVKLFFHPIKTLKYFFYVLRDTFVNGILFVQKQPLLLFFVTLIISTALFVVYVPGQHQEYLGKYTDLISICFWWVGLGILSSVGLGTGLHTFVLYLGPHIAKVTLAATEWRSLDFEQYGPNSFINPNLANPSSSVADASLENVSFWSILQAVQLAALMWGAGTAIGELPPYFVARTARLKGLKLEQEEEKKKKENGTKNQANEKEEKKGLLERLSSAVPALIGNMGFFGILAFASIPNPLFDLAGITCGHFLVPFWKFFGATLIGKAVVKAHIQACFVILAFNMETLTWVIAKIEEYIPWSKGKVLPILEKERERLNSSTNTQNAPKSYLGVLWDCVLAMMILYFLISIVDSSVQEYLIDKDNKKIETLKEKLVGKESKKNK